MAAGQVRYNPKYKKQLHDKFGPGAIAKLFELIGEGSIEQLDLEKMSYSYHMNVSETFNQCLSEKKKEKATLEDMLDKWYEEFLAVKSVSEARSEFLRILRATCTPYVCSSIKKELEKNEKIEDLRYEVMKRHVSLCNEVSELRKRENSKQRVALSLNSGKLITISYFINFIEFF